LDSQALRSDTDYRALAHGYLARAKRSLERLERNSSKAWLHALGITAVPIALAQAPTLLNAGSSLPLTLASLIVGICIAVFAKRSELTGKDGSTREHLHDVIVELDNIPASGALSAFHRVAIDRAEVVLQRLVLL
jgi:hypothetical protein